MEQITQWDPDVIVFAPDSIYDSVASDSAWAQLKAIKIGQLLQVSRWRRTAGWDSRPPSTGLWASSGSPSCSIPMIFSYDLKAETVKFYKLFYHCDLTDAQYNDLVKGRPEEVV